MGGVDELLSSIQLAENVQVSPQLVRRKDRHMKAIKKLIRQNAEIAFLAFDLLHVPNHCIVDLSGGLALAINNAGVVLPADSESKKDKQMRKGILSESAMKTDAAWLVMGLPVVMSLNNVLNDLYRKEESHWNNTFFRTGSCALTLFDCRPNSDAESDAKVQQKCYQFQEMLNTFKSIGEESGDENLEHFPLLQALIKSEHVLQFERKTQQAPEYLQPVEPRVCFEFVIKAIEQMPENESKVCY